MNANELKWDDFKIVLAIGTTASLIGAAKQTGLSHTTVFRRLVDIEEKLGAKLFWRNREGYSPTEIGELILESGSKLEAEIDSCLRKVNGQDAVVQGTIRVTTTDTLLNGLIAPLLSQFMKLHPNLTIELITTNKLIDLTRRDADIAIRPASELHSNIVGRKVGQIEQRIYTHRDNPLPENLLSEGISMIGPDSEMLYSSLEQWFIKQDLSQNCFLRTNSILNDYHLLRTGYGYAVLPCYLGDSDSALKPVSNIIDELTSTLWISTHPDLRQTLKIKVFITYMAEQIAAALRSHSNKAN